ncbi:MAG: ABC transporter permease [Deltaproteobacteria bacterium]|nr:ABC transporter permease [Deltaproteobacteria bacterium]MBI3076110.1 ABC transporter permease [Deltaproteobacteria bacterium]
MPAVTTAKIPSLGRSTGMRIFWYRVLFGLAVMAFWEYSADRLISSFWVSSPSRIGRYLLEVILDGSIFDHLQITLVETLIGYVVGASVGVATGFLLARIETVAMVLDPYIIAFYGIPRIALAPLFIIWFGIGMLSKVILVITVVFFLTFFNTYSGVKGVDPELKNILRVMGAREYQIMMKITVPSTVPWIMAGLKISVPYALVGAVVGEFIAASKGLGYLIQYNSNLFNTTGAMAGIIILAVIVVVGNEIINRVENYILRWRPREKPEPTEEERPELF